MAFDFLNLGDSLDSDLLISDLGNYDDDDDFWSKTGDFLGGAWDFVASNDDLMAGLAFGAVSGIGKYLTTQDQLKAEEKRWQAELAQRERINERKASSGEDNYGSHIAGFQGGTGLLAPYTPMKLK